MSMNKSAAGTWWLNNTNEEEKKKIKILLESSDLSVPERVKMLEGCIRQQMREEEYDRKNIPF